MAKDKNEAPPSLRSATVKALEELEGIRNYIKIQCIKGRREVHGRGDRDTLLRVLENIEGCV